MDRLEGYAPTVIRQKVLVHGHCHKSIMKLDADHRLLKRAGIDDELIKTSCCGMAGSFGFESEHYDLSIQCGELSLFPAVRSAPRDAVIVADGFSCREQIEQATGRKAVHTAELLAWKVFFGDQARMPVARRKSLIAVVILVAVSALFLVPVSCGPLIHSRVIEVAGIDPDLAPPSNERPSSESEPYSFQSSDTLVVVPSHRYDAGPLWKAIFGTGYRSLWTHPVAVPVIDLERTAGGLVVTEEGGGTQTRSLHLLGGDGHGYVLRSVDKDVSRLVPAIFQRSAAAYVLQDMLSALNPYAALAVAKLASSGDILHAKPTLVLIPDSPVLGPHRESFRGMLALFERKPDEDQSRAARFGYAANVIGTKKLFEELQEDAGHSVDQRAYARARLFDMWIGDWDRGPPQWRWAEYETSRGKQYVPVPRDRDYAFSDFDGLFHRLVRLTGIPSLRHFGAFSGRIEDLVGLNEQASDLDLRFTSQLTHEDWLEIADSLKSALTDAAIEEAIGTWPPSIVQKAGLRTAGALKSRRSQLRDVAASYHDLLQSRR